MSRSEVTKGDLEAIRRLVKGTGVFSQEETNVAVELAEDCQTRGAKSDYHFLFEDTASGLAGYTCYGRVPFTDERYDLYWIVVDKQLQQKGIASGLLKATESAIRMCGGKMLYAETSSRAPYEPAHAFYSGQGFKEVARLKDFYKDGDDKIIFEKRL